MNDTPDAIVNLGTARVLLGWLETDQAVAVQYQGRANVTPSAEVEERVRKARQRVAARPGGIDQRDILAAPPAPLTPYVEGLLRHPAMEQTVTEGWSPQVVDLRRLCAFQSRVFTDFADERVRTVDPNDLVSIASVALPSPDATSFPAHYDPMRQAWVVTSADPNLKVIGNFGRKFGDDVAGFGFSVALGRSFMKAVDYQGRYYLTDGYHRAVAFLRRGITHVPLFTRVIGADEPFEIPHGMLPAATSMGERPPLIPDFLADDVSLSVRLPLLRKIIVIQALEVLA